jgi:hypothetical protein
MALINRWFVRCRLCLSIGAVDAISLPKGTLVCSGCDGPIEIMGRVDGCTSHLETRCKCDARCTNAKGPNCDCSCGGKNHGSGMLVSFAEHSVSGCVLRINATDKALAVAKEFREAMIPLNREIRLLIEQRNTYGGRLPSVDYSRLCYLERVRSLARKSKTHTKRMELLKEFKGTKS